jgi:hypothetical protein
MEQDQIRMNGMDDKIVKIERKLDDHMKTTCDWRKGSDERMGRIEKNTEDIVRLFEGARTTVNVVAGIGKAVKWVAGTGVAGWAIYYFAKHGAPPPEHLP